MIDKSKLKELALAAMPGEWLHTDRTVYALQHAGWKKGVEQFENRFYCGIQHGRGTPEIELEANAAYIAAANPAAILELLAELDRATRALVRGGFEDRGGEEWAPPIGPAPRFIEVSNEAVRNAALEEAAKLADKERAEFVAQAGMNNGRESDFAFGSVNSAERIAAAIRSLATTTSTSAPAPSAKQEPSDDYDLRAEQAYFDRWPDIAAPSASASPAAPVAQDEAHQARLTLIRASGDQELIEAVRHGRVSISAALAKVVGAAPVAGSQQVPEGYALVPVEPTPEMLVAGVKGFQKAGYNDCDKLHDWTACYRAMLAAAPAVPVPADQFDFHAHLARQAAFSLKTFGPGMRTAGVCDHIRKELKEIEADPSDLREWIDVVILALDGAWRCGGSPEQIIDGIIAKQAKNEGRNWPDWRTADPNKAIEHDRSGEAAPSLQQGKEGAAS